MVDLGAEPWIVANALQAVIAQRLIRTLCDCAESYSLPHDMLADAESDEERIETSNYLILDLTRVSYNFV